MAATVGSTRVEAGRVRQLATTGGPGRARYVLPLLLALDATAVAVTAVLMRDLLRGPAVTVGNLQGTALVMGVVTVPVLLMSMLLVARGSTLAWVGWLGAMGSIAYQSILFLFAAPFNAFFFLYVALLSLSVWSLIVVARHLPVDGIASCFDARLPVRALAAYLLLNGGAFLAMWLSATVPAVLSSDPPSFLEGTGMITGPVQILDLAFTLPLMALAAVLLWRRRPWGVVLTGALLVMLAIETASIAVDQWLGHAADPASPAASAEIVPVMAVLTVIGLAALAVYLRAATRPSAATTGAR